MTSSAPTPASVATPSKLWWGVGLAAIASTVVGVVVFVFLRRRRRLSFSRRSMAGVGMLNELEDLTDADWLDVDELQMTPVPSTVAIPRYARDSDGMSPSSLQLLFRESAAPAFMGEGLSLVPKPTRTNIHAHPRHSELEPGGGHVEQGPH